MMTVTLPRRRALQQPLTSLASSATILLSLGMTLTAACRHWSADTAFAVGTALTCELCKLALSKAGITNLRTAARWNQGLFATAQLVLAGAFAVGSVGASVLCMAQAQQVEHARDLQSSRAYASAQQALHSLDTQITTLEQAANSDISGGFRTRGLATFKRLEALNAERHRAEESVATLEHHPVHAAVGTSPLSSILTLLNAPVVPATAELLIEILIGVAIELASFLFLCGASPAMSHRIPPEGPQGSKSTRTHAPSIAPKTQAFALQVPDTAQPRYEAARPSPRPALPSQPVPPTYARWLRFAFGPRLKSLLQALECGRSAAACRELLHRMGEHCLGAGWSNGRIEVVTIRQSLRGGRDWRTIQGYLARLVDVGALTFDGSHYIIEHFLDANPSVQRREQRLAQDRHKNCKRQRKLRNRLQTLHALPLQNVDLTASCTLRNAEKPQPTSHAVDVEAAHAATHQPTSAVKPPASRHAEQQAGAVTDQVRNYGTTSASEVSDADHDARMARLVARGVTREEADEAAAFVERELAEKFEVVEPRTVCIPVKIPAAPPVNEGSVAAACRLVQLPEESGLVPALFRQLSLDRVTEAELTYAAWCTKRRRDQGRIKESVVGFMVGIIRRQRAAVKRQTGRLAPA